MIKACCLTKINELRARRGNGGRRRPVSVQFDVRHVPVHCAVAHSRCAKPGEEIQIISREKEENENKMRRGKLGSERLCERSTRLLISCPFFLLLGPHLVCLTCVWRHCTRLAYASLFYSILDIIRSYFPCPPSELNARVRPASTFMKILAE